MEHWLLKKTIKRDTSISLYEISHSNELLFFTLLPSSGDPKNSRFLTQCPLKKMQFKTFFPQCFNKRNVALIAVKCGGYTYIPVNTTRCHSKYSQRLLFRFHSGSIITTQRNFLFSLPFSLCYNADIVFHPYFCLNEFWLLPKINPLPSTHDHSPLRRIKRRKTKKCASDIKGNL